MIFHAFHKQICSKSKRRVKIIWTWKWWTRLVSFFLMSQVWIPYYSFVVFVSKKVNYISEKVILSILPFLSYNLPFTVQLLLHGRSSHLQSISTKLSDHIKMSSFISVDKIPRLSILEWGLNNTFRISFFYFISFFRWYFA